MTSTINKHFISGIAMLACPLLLFAQGSVSGEAGQVGFGIASPNASAKLEVFATNKGFLAPRVSLTGTSDVATIASPAVGLMVYNTATAGTSPTNVTQGFYYHDGTKWQRLINQYSDATISFDKATPTTSGVAFTPSIPQNADYIYVSTVDASQWTWNGLAYVVYAPIAATPWYTTGTTTDAGASKTANIYRSGKLGIGVTSPTATLELGTANGSVAGELVLNPKNTSNLGGGLLIKKALTGSSKNWVMEQYMGLRTDLLNPRFRILPSGDETLGLSIMENGKMAINPTLDYTSQSETLLVNGTTRVTGSINAAGGLYASAGLTTDYDVSSGASLSTLPMTDASDPNSWWDGTNYRFLPQVAGYYYISAIVNWQGNSGAAGNMNLYIYKNNTDVLASVTDQLPTKSSTTQLATTIVYLNGTTDNVQIRVLNNGTNPTSNPAIKITGAQHWTRLDAYKIN